MSQQELTSYRLSSLQEPSDEMLHALMEQVAERARQSTAKFRAEMHRRFELMAGPNGSGKTTTTELLLANEWGANSLYINPDNIAEHEFGGWNSPDAVMKAAQRATELRYQCLEERRDFVFETVFSSAEKLEFLRKAYEAGFFIRLFYVCTKSPEINVSRIAKRYMNGGHEVPISKVVSRYFKSLELARQAIPSIEQLMALLSSVTQMTSQNGLKSCYSLNLRLSTLDS